MNRDEWLKWKHSRSEEHIDKYYAPTYDEGWGRSIRPAHSRMLQAFLSQCLPGGTVLDAACGTGKYWPLILESGRSVVGTDQSAEMLRRASEKFPDVPVHKIGLEELQWQAMFEGVICIDAMSGVCPEDWPRVLANFHRALRPGGILYLTVEFVSKSDRAQWHDRGMQLDIPVVKGELGHTLPYGYYPPIRRARKWIRAAGFSLLEETLGGRFHHLLMQKPATSDL